MLDSAAPISEQERYAGALRRNNPYKLNWATGVAFGRDDRPNALICRQQEYAITN
jgi:hypothetical protein